MPIDVQRCVSEAFDRAPRRSAVRTDAGNRQVARVIRSGTSRECDGLPISPAARGNFLWWSVRRSRAGRHACRPIRL